MTSNTYRKHGVAACVAGAWLAGSTAFAAGSGFYIGGSAGQSDEQFDASTFKASSSATGYEVALGYRPLPIVAGELDYIGFPRAYSGINYADTYGVGVFALGFLPIPVVDLFGKLGLVDSRTDAQSPGLAFHRTGTDLAYGVGAGTSWGKLGARLEFEKFDVAHTSNMNLASIGLTWAL